MKVQAPTVIIDRDVMTKVHKQVWPWELDVLQERFGEDRVVVQKVSEVEVSRLPEATDEYGRMMSAFGSDDGDGGSNTPYVQLAYGRGKSGIAELGKAIKASTKKPRKKAAAKKPTPAPVVEEAEGDPLEMG